MPKKGGLGATISVDDSGGTLRNISTGVTNFAVSTPRGVQDVTGVDKSAMERLLLLADFSFTPSGVFDDTATVGSHIVFRTVPSTSVLRTTTVLVNGVTLTGELLYSDYSITRAQDGSLTWTAPGVLADGAVPTWA